MYIVCLVKSKTSYERIKMQYKEKFVFEDHIEDIEELQERIVFSDYDIAIVDDRLYWKNEAVELLNKKKIKIILFKGDFEQIENNLNEMLPKETVEEEQEETKEEDKTKIKYVEKIVEKPVEVKVKVPVYKSMYNGIPNKFVGVISLSERAGATFFTLNFAKALAERKILTTIIEPPFKPSIYNTVGFKELIKDLEFYSYPHEIDENNKLEKDKEITIEDIYFIVTDPEKKKIGDFNYDKMLKLLYSTKKTSISFIDFGSNFKSITELIDTLDLTLVIVDPFPADLLQNIDKLQKLLELKDSGQDIEFVINKSHKCLDKKMIEDFLTEKPKAYIPHIGIDLLYKSNYNFMIPYSLDEVKEKLDSEFSKIFKLIIPNDLFKSRDKKEKKKGFFSRRNKT